MVSRALPELINGPEGPNISLNGRVLYSASNNPIKRAEQAAAASQTLYLVLSPLLFTGVETLLERISPDSFVLAIEKNPDIYKLTEEFFTPLNNRSISYLYTGNNSSPSNIIRAMNPSRFRRVVTVKLNGGYMLNRGFYNSFASAAENFLQSFWKNRITTIHMGRLWCRNIFLNLPLLGLTRSLSELHTDKPVIAIGAGESLDGCISFIKANRNTFFLAAADTAVSTLLNNGITPDLLIVLEAQHANLYDFYDPEALRIPAAFDLTSSPEVIRKHQGKKYFFISEFDRTQFLTSLKNEGLLPPLIPPLGSVGIAAVYIALCISNNIVLHCGLDFSFIPDKYHSSGSPSHIISMMKETRTNKAGFFSSAFNGNRVTRTGKSGRTVFTDLIMLSYAGQLGELGRLSSRLVDIAEYGIKSTEKRLTEPDAILELVETFCSADKIHVNEADNIFRLDGTTLFKNQDKTAVFLDKEIIKIEKVITAVIAYLNSANEDKSGLKLPEELKTQIKQIDYTHLFFPDYYNPAADVSFLKRLLFSASWFKKIIQQAITGLN
ncbi:MAG: motility associated factor glycosyltransferase family protein [Spirochaetales bacterium]|nr:motility associated factor glycosyltransferase family protein [Spirochaetales bacterium]